MSKLSHMRGLIHGLCKHSVTSCRGLASAGSTLADSFHQLQKSPQLLLQCPKEWVVDGIVKLTASSSQDLRVHILPGHAEILAISASLQAKQ